MKTTLHITYYELPIHRIPMVFVIQNKQQTFIIWYVFFQYDIIFDIFHCFIVFLEYFFCLNFFNTITSK